MACKGKGYILKMPENEFKACRLCSGTGKNNLPYFEITKSEI
jgi:hypothetical protein